jgi:uncharacterized protein involved in exopolysaccharide biosynthesis/Mrp family chromosome partitioning ATPase
MTGNPNMMRLIFIVRRHVRALIAGSIVGLVIGFIQILWGTPLYTASATLMIGDGQLRQQSFLYDRDTAAAFGSSVADPALVESQSGIIRSEQLGLEVVRNLKLADDPSFVPPPRLGLTESALQLVLQPFERLGIKFAEPSAASVAHETNNLSAAGAIDSDLKRQLRALKALERNLEVSHLPHTLLLQVDYTAPDPVRAAEIANAIAENYVRRQSNLLSAASDQARNSLRNHVEELSKLSAETEFEVQKFKTELNKFSAEADQSMRRSSANDNLAGPAGSSASEQQTNETAKQLFLRKVQLVQMEQKADSYRALYNNYMNRYQNMMYHDALPQADSYVISAANPALEPRPPKKSFVLAVSLFLGACAGIGVGVARQTLDGSFRTSQQVREEVGVDVIGFLPILPKSETPIMRHSIDHPCSKLSEALRWAKVTVDEASKDHSPKIIGVVSLFPNEGNTVVAKNFASLLALQCQRTLLIEAGAQNSALASAIRSDDIPPTMFESRILRCEPDSNLHVLPSSYSAEGLRDTYEDLRITEELSHILNSLQSKHKNRNGPFDYIVIDFPPIGSQVAARCSAAYVDQFLLVIAWGTTPRSAVRSALARQHLIKDKLLGVIFNKIDTKKFKNYADPRSDGFYDEHYRQVTKKDNAGRLAETAENRDGIDRLVKDLYPLPEESV